MEQQDENTRKENKAIIVKTLSCFSDCMIAILQMGELWPKQVLDAEQANQAFSITMTYHRARCQETTNKGTIKDQIADGCKVTVFGGVELDWKDLKNVLNYLFDKDGLKYETSATTKNWYSVANPVLYSFFAFGKRMQEVHMGRIGVKTKTDTSQNKYTTTIMKYGMNIVHSVLCEGFTFPPFMKNPLLTSLGPGTLLAYWIDNLEKSENVYKDRIKGVLLEVLSQVPRIDEILNHIGRSR